MGLEYDLLLLHDNDVVQYKMKQQWPFIKMWWKINKVSFCAEAGFGFGFGFGYKEGESLE